MKKLSIAAAMIALVATPAFAGTAPFGARESVSIRVSTDGLNLSNARDVARLQKRVDRAIALACNPSDRFNLGSGRDTQCHNEMIASAGPAVQNMAQSQRSSNTQISQN